MNFEAIKDYNWKPFLEIFYGAGAALVLAIVLVLFQNNPFNQSIDNFDTFAEWQTWLSLIGAAIGRSVWVFASSVSGKVLQKFIDALGPTNGEGGQSWAVIALAVGLTALIVVLLIKAGYVNP